jgi:hypothetical protein
MRPATKPCVWLGAPDCYRDQASVLNPESPHSEVLRRADRARGFRNAVSAAGVAVSSARARSAGQERGGVTPFNTLPFGAENRRGNPGHGAPTPRALTRWWVRYITPPGGTVLDPFAGSGTTLLAAHAEGRSAIGIERDAGYCAIIRKRLAEVERDQGLFAEATTCANT